MRVVQASLHGVSARTEHLAHALRLGRAGVVAFSECYPQRLQDYLGKRLTWRRFTGATNRVDSRGRHVGHDVTIMVRRWRRVLAHGSFKAADEVPASIRVAPERWVVWALLGSRRRPLLVVGVHPHAVPTPGTVRGREYAQEWQLVEALVNQQHTRHPNLRVVLMGDLNHRDDKGALSPAPILKRLGMSWYSHGLDWLAWSGLRLRGAVTTVPPEKNGQDHPWLVADLT